MERELKEDTPVFNVDGEKIGEITRFVLNPVSRKVTHIVVQKGMFFPEDKVVPIEWVAYTQADRIVLSARSDTAQELPPFEETQYVDLDEAERRRLAQVPYTYTSLPA